MMKKLSRNVALLLILAILGGMTLSSCRILRGDPRKNCNHPQHGQYMLEKRKKTTGF
ncbi:MAG: hypothetical protein SF052_06355 [Bacteroidia bacterium]|nr:hypothetical protein [Bacteroidia bacterium]